MKIDHHISDSLYNLERYVRNHNYSGYDPYDTLNSEKLQSMKSKLLKIAATQIFVYSPLNLRNYFKIMPEKNSKAIGLFLQAYCKLFKNGLITKNHFENVYNGLSDFLMQNYSKGYSGYCWGFNFNWQDLTRYTKKWLPTMVVTSYVGNSFLDLYEITKDKRYLETARSSCQFILKDLYITKAKQGICFSYTPIDTHLVHNANVLGAALLARVYSITKEDILLEHSRKAFDFLISHQKDNGSWAYSINSISEKERHQIDFHQGFILDSICDVIKYINPMDSKYKKTLLKGAEFYRTMQFDKSGRSKWRLPYRWPVDIHNQSQGIITFCKLYEVMQEKKYLEFAKKIAKWTITNMQDPSGYFYHQKWPIFTNKITYMRWGQAWMMLALSEYLSQSLKDGEGDGR